MLFIGIDISKASFDVNVINKNKTESRSFDNSNKGFKAFLSIVKKYKEPLLFCMEATGNYGLALAKYLYHSGYQIMVVNPIKTHAFAKMEMSRNKTDKADAMSIARYCRHLHVQGQIECHLFKPKDSAFEELQYLITRLEQLDNMATQEKNRLGVSVSKTSSRSIKAMIKHINKQVIDIKKTIKDMVNNSEMLKQQVQLLVSIHGIADKTAWSILAYIGDISLFSTAKQVTSYAGISPKIIQSGSSINKTSLSKLGNKRLRKALYMPALVAIKHNPVMAAFYNQLLKNGKPKKVAVCAVMRKLLVLSYGVLKSGVPFDPCYQTKVTS